MKRLVFILLTSILVAHASMVAGSESENKSEPTKIYTVFLTQGYLHTGGPVEHPLTNNDVLKKLRNSCDDIDFIARDLTKADFSRKSVLNELENSKGQYDGVLLIGPLHQNKLAFTGLPTIVVWNLWEWDQSPYKLFAKGGNKDVKSVMSGAPEYENGRIITAQIDRRQVSTPANSKAMFDDLIGKIELIQAIKKLKESRILSVSPLHHLARVDYQGDVNQHMPENYSQNYMKKVRDKFGVEIIRVPPEEFYEAYEDADPKEAEKIAEKWIQEAAGVKTTKAEILKTAKGYLAFDALRKKYNCNAISTFMRSVSDGGEPKDLFWPGLGLEWFKTKGIQATCQNYPNALITQLLGYYITGRPSMLGDLMIDTHHSASILLHCSAPINPYGDQRRVPFIIKTHAQSPYRSTPERAGSGTGMQVFWPKKEPATVWKVYPLLNKIGYHKGEVIDGYALYDNYEDIVCRNKVLLKVDHAKTIQNHFYGDAYGIHRVATLGDLEEKIKDLATLMGMDIMNEQEPLSE